MGTPLQGPSLPGCVCPQEFSIIICKRGSFLGTRIAFCGSFALTFGTSLLLWVSTHYEVAGPDRLLEM